MVERFRAFKYTMNLQQKQKINKLNHWADRLLGIKPYKRKKPKKNKLSLEDKKTINEYNKFTKEHS